MTQRAKVARRKGQNEDDVASGSRKGQTFGKRVWKGPECNNGIRNRGLRHQANKGPRQRTVSMSEEEDSHERHRRVEPWTAIAPVKRRNAHEGPILVFHTEDRGTNSRNFHRVTKNDGLDTVEESAPTEVEKEVAHEVTAGDVGAPLQELWPNVTYLLHARTSEPQEQPLLSGTHACNRTRGLINLFVENGSETHFPVGSDVTQQWTATM
jgi:hypothetical protein